MRSLLFVLAWCAAAQAEIRVAQEVELAPTALATIIDHFEIEKIDSPTLRQLIDAKALTATPRLTMETWSLLPEALRQQLSAGLTLPSRTTLESNPLPKSTQILAGEFREGKAQAVAPPPTAPKRKDILGLDGEPIDLDVTPSQKTLDLGVPKVTGLIKTSPETDWPVLEARWEKYWSGLSMAERRNAIPLQMLPRLERARIAIEMAPGSKDQPSATWLPLRENAPEGLRDALLGIEWGRDLDTMEFKHKGTTTDRNAYLRRLSRFQSIAHQPENGIDGSYHLNISQDGRNLEKFAEQYNYLLLLRLLNSPGMRPFESKWGFHLSFREKGIVCLSGPRLEVRNHSADPRAELEELAELLGLPEDEALLRMATETQRHLTENATSSARIAEEYPIYLYRIVESTQKVIGPKATWKASDPSLAKTLIRKGPERVWGRRLQTTYDEMKAHVSKSPDARIAFENLNHALLAELSSENLAIARPDVEEMGVFTAAAHWGGTLAHQTALADYVWSRAQHGPFDYDDQWGRTALRTATQFLNSNLEERFFRKLIPPPYQWKRSFLPLLSSLAVHASEYQTLFHNLRSKFKQHYLPRLKAKSADSAHEACSQLSEVLSIYDPMRTDEILIEAFRDRENPNRSFLLNLFAERVADSPQFAIELLTALPEVTDPVLTQRIRDALSASHIYDSLMEDDYVPQALKQTLASIRPQPAVCVYSDLVTNLARPGRR